MTICNGHTTTGECALPHAHGGPCLSRRSMRDHEVDEAIKYLRDRVAYLEERAMADSRRIALLERR